MENYAAVHLSKQVCKRSAVDIHNDTYNNTQFNGLNISDFLVQKALEMITYKDGVHWRNR